ncbi:MAG: PAS domain S-box protein, partial [Proteobacteria bacterium]|nr:PAS domain S-box protein [Pseudomonadota bacterium]
MGENKKIDAQRLLQEMSSSIPGVLYQIVRWPDGSLTVPFVTESVKELCGHEAQEFIDNPYLLIELIVPDDRELLEEALQKSAISTRKATYALRIIDARGKERWLLATANPRLVEGNTIRWTGVIQDITTQKRAQFELQRQRNFNSTILDTVANLVVVLDQDGTILWFNRACERTTGYSRSE